MSEHRIMVGELVPDFSLEDTFGNEIVLSNFKGNRNVFLVFNRGFL